MTQFNGNSIINQGLFPEDPDPFAVTSGQYLAALLDSFHDRDSAMSLWDRESYSCSGIMPTSAADRVDEPRVLDDLHRLLWSYPASYQPSCSSWTSIAASIPQFNGQLFSFTDIVPGIRNDDVTSESITDTISRIPPQSSPILSPSAPDFNQNELSPLALDSEDYNIRTNTWPNGKDEEQVLEVQVSCSKTAPIDSYSWRKYGQKNIKGRKFPRSYFRCAEASCSVKKYTEKSSELEGYLVVTYYGKHNHS